MNLKIKKELLQSFNYVNDGFDEFDELSFCEEGSLTVEKSKYGNSNYRVMWCYRLHIKSNNIKSDNDDFTELYRGLSAIIIRRK